MGTDGLKTCYTRCGAWYATGDYYSGRPSGRWNTDFEANVGNEFVPCISACKVHSASHCKLRPASRLQNRAEVFSGVQRIPRGLFGGTDGLRANGWQAEGRPVERAALGRDLGRRSPEKTLTAGTKRIHRKPERILGWL
jgi:hypothetical protein